MNEVNSKTHWKNQFQYDYLGAYSLVGGIDLVLTIKSLAKEMVTGPGGRKEELLVCQFHEDVKPMILNKTNCKIIEDLYNTPYTEDWPGKKIQLYIKSGVKFGNETTDALRIREKAPVVDPEKIKLKELSSKVIAALDQYAGEDVESIRAELQAKNKEKKIDIKYLESVLSRLSTPKAS